MTEDFLNEALKEAVKAEKIDEVPVGAVVVFNGKIIARAHNLRETTNDPLGHAELLAIRKAAKKQGSWRLTGCDVYVTLEPCTMCAAAFVAARVRHVYYGAKDPKAGAVSLGFELNAHNKLNHRYMLTNIETPACGKILTDFFKKKRNQ